LGVAPTTARTHLQRIFDKSGARRQSDLQRLIFAPMAAG
jgi:DNA-binding CsgD family transcriptional regulator